MALAALGRGTCYWPEPPCAAPVVAMVRDRPLLNLQIAHIHAAYPDGPRYRANMTNEQRRDFSNLMLLCTPHHTYIDKSRPDDFPADLLKKWKHEKEKEAFGQIGGLQGLTDENLSSAVIQSLRDATRELREALERAHDLSPLAADLLKAVSEGEILYFASRDLRGLPDAAETLYLAARQLPPNLSGTADILANAAHELRGLPDVVSELRHQVSQLRQIQGDR